MLVAYEKVALELFQSFNTSFEELVNGLQDTRPSYSTFKHLANFPSPQLQYLQNWLDASLQFEMGIILADLILTGQMKFPKKRIEGELLDFLISSITRFGGYAMFIGLWNPGEELFDDGLINRMKIFAGTLELENGLSVQISDQDILSLLYN